VAKKKKAKGKAKGKTRAKGKKAGKYRSASRLASDIGIIHSGTSGKHDSRIKDFADGVKLYTNDRPRAVKYAKNKRQDLDTHARDLVNSGVTVLVAAGGSQSGIAARAATTSKPIVVTSISNPPQPVPANLVGISTQTSQLDPKRLELLVQCLPGVRKIGALHNSKRFNAAQQKTALDNKAAALGLAPLDFQPVDPDARSSPDQQIKNAFQSWKTRGLEAVIVAADPLFNDHMDTIIAAANNPNPRRLPAIHQWRQFADDGGLISYGPNLDLAYRLAGTFAGRLANDPGAVSQLSLVPLQSFELVINLKTAQDLGIDTKIPPALLAQANDVIV
jgi:putative tryptophan/tyrosine transport system substrate-binding protein